MLLTVPVIRTSENHKTDYSYRANPTRFRDVCSNKDIKQANIAVIQTLWYPDDP